MDDQNKQQKAKYNIDDENIKKKNFKYKTVVEGNDDGTLNKGSLGGGRFASKPPSSERTLRRRNDVDIISPPRTSSRKIMKCSNQNIDTKMALLSGGLLLFSILSMFSCSYCIYLDEYSSNHIQHSINLLLICVIEILMGSQNIFNRITKKKTVNTLIELDILLLIIGSITLFYAIYKRNDILLDYVVPINIVSLILSIYYLRSSFKSQHKKISINYSNDAKYREKQNEKLSSTKKYKKLKL